jgi:catechol 2,3-dioxygenase-like lactoylglutathione lyase family enzyme
MAGPIRSLVPHAFVEDMRASIAFYRKLGFELSNSFTPQGADGPTWCWLTCERGGLMLGQAREPVIADQQRLLLYAYCDDIDAAHAELAAHGVEVGPITKPFYNPGGEFRVNDPDGYAIWVAQI